MSDFRDSQDHLRDGFRVGNWVVEPMLNRMRHEDDDREVQLEPKVMDVLLCLAATPGDTVTKETFKETVWKDTVVTDDVLSRCISRLRKVVGDDSRDPSYIETIRKTGYRLVAPVEVDRDDDDAPAEPASTDDPSVDVRTADDSAGAAEKDTTSDRSVRSLVDRLSDMLRGPSATKEETWVVFAGGSIQRRSMVLIAAASAVALVVGGLFWFWASSTAETHPAMTSRPFTSYPGEEFEPALSPNGQQVAFTWRNVDSLDQSIFLTQPGAERPLRLSADSTRDWSPTWSPDGRHVAYAAEADDRHFVSIVPSIGGRARRVLSFQNHRRIESLAWSPDTTRREIVLSVQQRPHQAYGLHLFRVDADSMVTLTSPEMWKGGDQQPAVSPDGSRIAFVRTVDHGVGDIFVVSRDGGTPEQVTTDSTRIRGLTWSSDGSEILFSARRDKVSGLWRMDADGGDPRLLRASSEGTNFSDPTVSRAGGPPLFAQQSTQLDIWKLERPSSYAPYRTTPLFASTREDTTPSVSPDGSEIAFVSRRSGTDEIWVGAADGSGARRVTALGGSTLHSVRWSPDGRLLCFIARSNGRATLHVTPPSGGASRRIDAGAAEAAVPRWSRDGRWIYFASPRTGEWNVWRAAAAADSQRVEQVTVGGAVAAQESADASLLYLVRPDTTGIWKLPLEEARLPVQIGAIASDTARSPSMTRTERSSDTRRSATRTGPAPSVRQVVSSFNPYDRESWWVDDTHLYYVHPRATRMVLERHELASGDAEPVTEFHHWRREDQTFAVAPDASWYAYTHIERQQSDIMTLEEAP